MKTRTHNDYTQRINRVADYINRHLDEAIDVKTLANIAHLSDYHFCRIFKAIKGEPPIASIARLRIETAAQLLRYSALPIEEIAFNIGYETPTSLSKAFKNQYGFHAPRMFRLRTQGREVPKKATKKEGRNTAFPQNEIPRK